MSPERDYRRRPDRNEHERAEDLAWIQQNLELLLLTAHVFYEQVGRGALMVDTTVTIIDNQGAGNPMVYLTQMELAESGRIDALRMVKAYDPAWEFVTSFLKFKGRESTYRIRVPTLRPPDKP